VPWIDPHQGEPEGLIGVGGDLSPGLLLRAYSEGVFPWFSPGDPVLWWSPDPRAIIELDALHVPRRLARTMRSGRFTLSVNRCFERVMRKCGENRSDGTWVTEDMVAGYVALHRAGFAHSLEVWCEVVICTSKRTNPRSRSRSTRATRATLDASVTRWNIDSPAKSPPTATP